VETFYSVLGVGRDADRETVVHAYRDEAKSHHPDVSDQSDATETFKRLTTAKEVLADEAERSAYDRLGHEGYLRRHGAVAGPSTCRVTLELQQRRRPRRANPRLPPRGRRARTPTAEVRPPKRRRAKTQRERPTAAPRQRTIARASG